MAGLIMSTDTKLKPGTGAFGDMAQQIEAAAGKLQKEFAENIYNEVTREGVTPYDTGTFVWSWRVSPVLHGYLPPVKEHGGAFPPKMNLDERDFKRMHKTFYVYNNQRYANKLNSMKKYENFIEGAVERASNMIGNIG